MRKKLEMNSIKCIRKMKIKYLIIINELQHNQRIFNALILT